MVRKLRIKSVGVGIIGVAVGAGLLIARGLQSAGLPFLVAGAGLLLAPFLGGFRTVTLEHYAQRTDRDMVVNYEFRADGLRCQTEASSSEMAWKLIAKVLRTPQGFVLYHDDRLSRWVPVHAFRDAQEVERFSELAKSSVEHYEQVR